MDAEQEYDLPRRRQSRAKLRPLKAMRTLFCSPVSAGRSLKKHLAEWLTEAKNNYDMVAGHQWDDTDRSVLEGARTAPPLCV